MQYKKTNKVKTIFNKISCSYDFLNSLLSLGLHKYWKKTLVDLLKPIDGENWADLCCGTGDLSFLIFKKVRPNGSVTGIDSACLLYISPSPRDATLSRMPSSA